MPRATRLQSRRLLLLVALALVLLLAVVLLLWRTVGQPRDRFWERIQETGRWQVGMDPSFPPFEDLDDDGRPVGFDVDLAEAIADRWGVAVELQSIGFDGLIDAVWASKVDTVLSALPLQPQFGKDVAFSQPYFEAGLVMVVGDGDTAIGTLEDLDGRQVAVEWGSEGDVQARELRRRFPTLQILPLQSPQEALEAVAAGRAQAAFVDNVSALQFAAGDPRVRILPEVIVSDPYVLAMPRKAPILQREVGEALEALQADGTMDRLKAKWFGSGR